MKMMSLAIIMANSLVRNAPRKKVWESLSPRNGATTAWLTQSSAAITSRERKTRHTHCWRLTTGISLMRSSAPQTTSTSWTTSRAPCSSATPTACRPSTTIIIKATSTMKGGSVWARVIGSSLSVVRNCTRQRFTMIMTNNWLRHSISNRLFQLLAVRPKLRIGGNFSVKMSSIGLINCR